MSSSDVENDTPTPDGNSVSPEYEPHRLPIAPGYVPPPSSLTVREQRRLPGGRMAAPKWEPPPFDDYHVRALKRLGLDDDAIEALCDEIDRESSHAATQTARGERAVRLAEQRAKDRAKEDLEAVDAILAKDEVQRRFDALHIRVPDLGEGSVASSLSIVFMRQAAPLMSAIRDQLEAEREYVETRKSVASRTTTYSHIDLQAAKMSLEITEEKVRAEEQAYREFLSKYDSDDMRERVADLEALLPCLSHSAFEEDLIPLVLEAGEAFDAFRSVVAKVKALVEDREAKLREGRALERRLAVKDEGLLPSPSQSLYDNYLTVAMRAVAARAHASDVLDFVTGTKSPAVESAALHHPYR